VRTRLPRSSQSQRHSARRCRSSPPPSIQDRRRYTRAPRQRCKRTLSVRSCSSFLRRAPRPRYPPKGSHCCCCYRHRGARYPTMGRMLRPRAQTSSASLRRWSEGASPSNPDMSQNGHRRKIRSGSVPLRGTSWSSIRSEGSRPWLVAVLLTGVTFCQSALRFLCRSLPGRLFRASRRRRACSGRAPWEGSG
jgi:hypothetical protein